MDVIGFEVDLIVLQCFEFVSYLFMIIYSAGVIGFKVDLIVLQGFAHKLTPLY